MVRPIGVKQIQSQKKKIESNPYVYSLEQMSEITGISAITLRQYVREGKIPAIKSGKTWFVENEDIARYLISRNEKRHLDSHEEIWLLEVEGGEDGEVIDSFLIGKEDAILTNNDQGEMEVLKKLGFADPHSLTTEVSRVKDVAYIYQHMGLLPWREKEVDEKFLTLDLVSFTEKQRNVLKSYIRPNPKGEKDPGDFNGKLPGELWEKLPPLLEFENWSIPVAKRRFYDLFYKECSEIELLLFIEMLKAYKEKFIAEYYTSYSSKQEED